MEQLPCRACNVFRHIEAVWLLIIGSCLGGLSGSVLLFLKLTGNLDWNWLWVTLPFGLFLITSFILSVFFVLGFPSSEAAAAPWAGRDKPDEVASPD
jgi:hypothetical protein